VRQNSVTSPLTSPISLSESELEAWGQAVGRAAARRGAASAPPLVMALRGPLGAGKSVLARAVARGAGVRSPMPSPTFNLLYEYQGDGVIVYHIDLYRLEDPDEVWELGWRELGQAGQVVLIEWPERAESLLPRPRWDVRLDIPSEGATLRTLSAARVGEAPELPEPSR
jgi:tRNA threonylcarbamoyladenosine biosynthesis protein TsaE